MMSLLHGEAGGDAQLDDAGCGRQEEAVGSDDVGGPDSL